MSKQVFPEIRWALFVLGRKLKSKMAILRRRFIRPQLPTNPDGKILIHLGCGEIASPEFINVDSRPAPHIHYVCDVTDLSIFPDNYADLVYACHILEHIRRNKLKNTLWEWKRILKPGGILRLSVPDIDALINIYEACGRSVDSIIAPLMGGQDYAENTHYSIFNLKYLTDFLTKVGFHNIRKWDAQHVSYHNFDDWASKTFERKGNNYQVSLNIEADK